MYQCPECGRIFIDDIDGNFHVFVPEETNNKQLLLSVENENWNGFLWGEWVDVKSDWMNHHGYIKVNTNAEPAKKEFVFDNKKEYEKQFYKLRDNLTICDTEYRPKGG